MVLPGHRGQPGQFRRDTQAGSLYWLGHRDANGQYLDGARSYKLTVPPPVPPSCSGPSPPTTLARGARSRLTKTRRCFTVQSPMPSTVPGNQATSNRPTDRRRSFRPSRKGRLERPHTWHVYVRRGTSDARARSMAPARYVAVWWTLPLTLTGPFLVVTHSQVR
jgi:hypothetical protein